jgi:hypothetical protein
MTTLPELGEVRPRETPRPTLETLLVERRTGANTGPGEFERHESLLGRRGRKSMPS